VTDAALGSIHRIQSTFDQLVAPAGPGATSGSASPASIDMFAKLVEALLAQSTTSATQTGATGDSIVSNAKTYEGIPYVWGGTSRDGIDCTGLVQLVLRDAGITVGRSMDAQMTAGTEVGALADAKPGDLIVLDGGAHIVIYSGNGNVIHAPEEGKTVTEQKVWFDDSDIVTIRRVAPEATVPTSPALDPLQSLQALISAQAALLSRSVS
jgi:cell wall-associated NlpC family hydrolase